jgi:DNA-binding response OmpR family regulator
MPDLLLLSSASHDWRTSMSEALSSEHTTRLLRVTDLHDLADANTRFDASILGICTLDAIRSAVGFERLGAILVVADRTDEQGRVAALESGVADCIAPDISGSELRARLAGILRRRAGAPPGSPAVGTQSGHWYLDLTRHFLTSPRGERIELPGATFEIFQALASRPQRVLSRSFLGSVLGNGKRTSARNIDVIITRLRHTLERHDPSGVALITTVRNEGYRMARDIQRDEHGITILEA